MRIPRFYIAITLAADCEIELPKEVAHYIANVLRLSAEAPIVLFNGDGNEYSATLTSVSKRQAQAYIDAKLSIDVQSNLRIHLGQAVSKGERMDWVLQKATELGVSEITPVITQRCAVKLSPERWQKKSEQWQKIIQSACEQCGRNTLPTLHAPVSTAEWLKAQTSATRIIFDPSEELRMANLTLPNSEVRVFVGPEGGLTEQEVYSAKQIGYLGLSLGPRILRTETAALATISALQAMHGDL
ncbi:16S rRNA (uracil(1498)-N(3))-methyltransferase [Alteromonas sp. ASW11-36]|uniref:Ribosomal RNA small subunit methyltransferase E n=1 Tax=Alteromonas arenosi TaxID=3055817 RepID=A0ABT7STI9_9ALTE|nr:16S rRNA (uracil(1498)-N(3))-methyltransferase [Alteromonas sp. ASW11-36]MDM7859507.1 16S rRNA (uracil(1498)-N(3))-methyltransferase [Alteromonas sp. ASW11-36]